MTEKSEDQVVWVCTKCGERYDNAGRAKAKTHSFCGVECEGNLIQYISHSQYLTLKKNLEGAEYIIDVEHRRNNKLESDLAVAVEALRRIAEPSSEDIVIPIRKIAKEALGKIGNK